jgi:Asp-tRNA(Asn)/Glu-tRNA(Gln) amidotransferase A subunit family amidase
MSDALLGLGAAELRRAIVSGEVSAVEVTKACLDRVGADALHAWTFIDPAIPLREAAQVDARRARGETLGALAGVPIGVKDIFNTANMPTQMGSPLWKGFTPGNDARVVYYLRSAGAIILGKTATAEFGVHALGDTVNPHAAARTPGTSSTGSAVAVAASHVPVALGTQTAGSIVRPASYCGVYGYKPSFGLLPRTGMLKTTDSLDTIGFIAKAAADLRVVFDVLRVRGRNHPISEAALADKTRQGRPQDRPWRLGLVRPHTWRLTDPRAGALLDAELARWARSIRADLVDLSLPPAVEDAHEIHATIYDKTLAYYFTEEYKQHKLVSPVFATMIEHGRTITVGDYKNALARQAALAAAVDAALCDVDALVTLSVAGEAPLRDAAEPADSCLVWTLCGLPAISVPALVGPSGLPIGVQLATRRFSDYRLLELVDQLDHAGMLPRAPHPQVRSSANPGSRA